MTKVTPNIRARTHVTRRRREDGVAPLSYQQRRLWFIDQLVQESPAYVIYTPIRVRGRLDKGALTAAIAEIARRHEILRSAFRSSHDGPVQVPRTWAARDLVRTVRLDGADEATLTEVLSAEARRGFQLQEGPLFRALIAELMPTDHAVMLAAHHAAVDGWSLGIILRELSELYRAFAAQQDSTLPEPGLQYGDFSWWQRDIPPREIDQHRRYWLRELADCPGMLSLPTDHPRPVVQRFRGKSYCWDLPAGLSADARAWCKSRGVTLFVGLLAAFCVLLRRYSGQDTVVVGTPVANRTRVEFEELVGFFANTVALRADLDGGITAADLLTQLRNRSLEAQEHQDMPFELLVDELKIARETSHNPMFQVLFAFQNTPRAPIELHGLECEYIDIENDTAKFDLSLHISEEPGDQALAGLLEFNTDLFDEATVRRMAGHYQRLLEEMVRDDSRPAEALPMLTPDEQRELVDSVNDTERPVPHVTLDDLIASQAERTPEAIAVECAQADDVGMLTFAELDSRASLLAARLAELGAGRGDVIATCLPRSAELVIALVAILKRGCVYCPLDIDLPAERLTYMMADSGCRIVLTGDGITLDPPEHVRELRITPATFQQRPAVEARARDHAPDDASYLIYTSGTTGRPKGSLVSHRAAVNRLLWMRDQFAVGPSDRILHKTPCGFDVSVWELVLPLLTGATMIVMPPGEHRDPGRVTAVLRDRQVSIAHFVPSALGSFLDRRDLPDLPALRCVFSSGEALAPAVRDQFFRRCGAVLHNLYGPTEAAIDVTWWECDPAGDPADSVPIGYPVANTSVYVLDPWLNPVPVGVPGELYLGGIQLAVGYQGKPALTAARFVASPFGGRSGERLYRTGDLVRQRPDLSLEFLGRTDHQVKIRGFRIEPAEIEHTLAEHPGISKALVMVAPRDDRPAGEAPETGSGQLTAYVVPVADWDHNLQVQQADSHVGHWGSVWDATYESTLAAPPGTGTSGWVDSYSGLPFSAGEMAEYTGGTAALLGPAASGAILEIGAGSGLILARLADRAREYWATDLSATAVRTLEQLAGAGHRDVPTVVRQQAADDMTGIPEEYFDAVVLSSTVQYFPSARYLARVLDLALRRLRPGGRLVIADVRNLCLADVFYASVELARGGHGTSGPALADAVQRRRDEETELLVAPAFFDEFCARRAGSSAEIRLKSGLHHNELTKYRYDVIIHRGAVPSAGDGWAERPWSAYEQDPAGLWRWVDEARPQGLVLRGITDGRTEADLGTVAARLQAGEPAAGTGQPQDPGEIAEHAAAMGYQTAAWWTGPGRFDAVFWTGTTPPLAARNVPADPGSAGVLANDPLRPQRDSFLSESARKWATLRLPDYMVPTAFVVLDSFPVGPNGKVDRRALAASGRLRGRVGQSSRTPGTPLERHLATIWAQLLHLDQVGADDNFFELGGDSILSVQVVNRAREEGVELSVREFFDHPTVSGLAGLVKDRVPTTSGKSADGWLDLLPEQRALLEAGPVLPVRHAVAAARPLRADLLASALEVAKRVHEPLRLRIEVTAGSARQRVLPAVASGGRQPDPTVAIALPGRTEPSEAGTIATLALRDGTDKASEFDLWVHPLVFDRTSVWLFLRAVEAAYLALEAGKVPDPPRPGVTYASLCASLPAEAEARSDPSGPARPGDAAAGQPHPRTCSWRLPAAPILGRLAQATSVFGNRVEDLLLTALALAWPGGDADGDLRVLLDRDQRHGKPAPRRAAADVIGCLTVGLPLALPRPRAGAGGAEVLRVVKERLRAADTARPGEAGSVTEAAPSACVRVRYVDERAVQRGTTMFSPQEDDDPRGYDAGGNAAGMTLTVRATEDSVHVRWSAAAACDVDLDSLAAEFGGQLTMLLEQCARGEMGSFVTGEFPHAPLSPERLRELSESYPAVEDVYPLAPFQAHQAQRLSQDPRHGMYLVWVTHLLDGLGLNLGEFISAWQDLMDRHAALRTGFLWARTGEPCQIVHRGPSAPVDYADLRDLPAAEQESRVTSYTEAVGRRRIDMSGGLQWRLGLFRTGEDRYRFVPQFSYMLQDGWTYSIFLEELFAFYEARISGTTPDLPELRPYRDHVAAVRSADQREAEEFWRSYLSGATLPTPVAAGILRAYGHAAESPGEDFEYRTEGVVLDKMLEHSLRAFARRHRLTLFTLLAGAWAIVAGDLADSADVVFGTVFSGRSSGIAGIEQMTGSFNNILPVRVRLPEHETVLSWLRGVQAAAMTASRFEQSFPAGIRRGAGVDDGQHVFESYLVLENFPMGRRFDQIVTEWAPGDEGATQTEHPLRVFIWPVGEFAIEISYYDNQFARRAIERVLAKYVECLTNVIKAPDARLGRLRDRFAASQDGGAADAD